MARKNSMWPAPVYEAHFADGAVRRTSFHQITGKPFDFERGARVISRIGRGLVRKTTGRVDFLTASIIDGPEHPQIVDGYVFHDDKIIRDPVYRGAAFYSCAAVGMTAKPARVTAAQLKAVLRRVLEGDENAISEARALAA